jgi:transcriptional regulator with XRE-family HTH domain
MGQASRERPNRLGEKLLQIRTALGLSQNEMIWKLGLSERLTQFRISCFERGTREPSLIVLLRYARVAGVTMEVLVDDEMDLPDRLPDLSRSRGTTKRTKIGQ